jgi:hypothetical protein
MVELGRPSDALDCFALGVRTFGGDHGGLHRAATDAGLEPTASETSEALRRADERLATSSALTFLEAVTGIGEEQTNAFIATFR